MVVLRQKGSGQNGTGQNGTGQNGTGQNGGKFCIDLTSIELSIYLVTKTHK